MLQLEQIGLGKANNGDFVTDLADATAGFSVPFPHFSAIFLSVMGTRGVHKHTNFYQNQTKCVNTAANKPGKN